MANFTELMENNVRDNNALLLHIQTRFTQSEADGLTKDELGRIEAMNKEIVKMKENAVTMDFGRDADKQGVVDACREITARCSADPQSNQFICLDNVFGNGMTSHKDLVDNLLQNRTLPTGEILPDNAVIMMTMEDYDTNNEEVASNLEKYKDKVESLCGGFVDIPRVPTEKDLSDMSRTITALQSCKEVSMDP